MIICQFEANRLKLRKTELQNTIITDRLHEKCQTAVEKVPIDLFCWCILNVELKFSDIQEKHPCEKTFVG